MGLPEFLARFFVAVAYAIAGQEKARQEVLRRESILRANEEADAVERARWGRTSGQDQVDR